MYQIPLTYRMVQSYRVLLHVAAYCIMCGESSMTCLPERTTSSEGKLWKAFLVTREGCPRAVAVLHLYELHVPVFVLLDSSRYLSRTGC